MARRFAWGELALVVAALLVLAGMSWGLVAWLSPKPANSTPSSTTVSETWETALKTLIKSQLDIALDAPVVDKPKTTEALKVIVKRLVDALPSPLPYPVDVVVVARPEINAFTFPGGLIVVDQALLEHSDALEVSAVLAHELGHVVHHDPADALGRTLVVAAIATLTTSSDAVAQIIQTLTQNAFSRQVEDRADAFAFELLARAHIKPSRLADFLASLPETPQTKLLGKNLPYLFDHPATVSRILKARQAPFAGDEEPLPVDWSAVQEELRARS